MSSVMIDFEGQRYVSPFTDFGLKRIFGDKELLLSFLNSLSLCSDEIVDVVMDNTEQVSTYFDERMPIFDLYCHTSTGERIIVEMQSTMHRAFVERAAYYNAVALTKQAERGSKWVEGVKEGGEGGEKEKERVEWKYKDMKAVYLIAFLNFKDPNLDEDVITTVKFCSTKTGKVVTNIQTMLFIQLPYFNKTDDECDTMIDKWIKNMCNMEDNRKLAFDEDPIFRRLEEVGSLAALTDKERDRYEIAWKRRQDALDYYYDAIEQGIEKGRAEGKAEGKAEGRAEERAEMILGCKNYGLSYEAISKIAKTDVNTVIMILKEAENGKPFGES